MSRGIPRSRSALLLKLFKYRLKCADDLVVRDLALLEGERQAEGLLSRLEAEHEVPGSPFARAPFTFVSDPPGLLAGSSVLLESLDKGYHFLGV